MFEDNQNEGMRYPSIDQFSGITSSKYKLVIAAAKRAREIDEKNDCALDKPRSKKSIGKALEEILAGKIRVL
jgi:DNA-directed RNA polymerase subunit omega